jgi:L-threonate 2-dehydrogenase
MQSVEASEALEAVGAVGFVGLGRMGQPLALSLHSAGAQVLGHARRPRPELQAAGMRLSAALATVLALDVVCLCLPDEQALVETVNALLHAGHAGQLVVDLGSSDPELKRHQAQRLAARGIVMLDCEVSGLPAHAEQRRAVIFTSGDAPTIERLKPLFDAMTEEHHHVGTFGTATRLKLIANTMVCVHNLMAAEAINLAARQGIDAHLLLRVLNRSAAGSRTLDSKGPLMAERDFEDGRGPFSHMFAYLRRAQALAREAGAATPMLDAAREVYRLAEEQGRHQQDIAAILEVIEARSQKAPL